MAAQHVLAGSCAAGHTLFHASFLPLRHCLSLLAGRVPLRRGLQDAAGCRQGSLPEAATVEEAAVEEEQDAVLDGTDAVVDREGVAVAEQQLCIQPWRVKMTGDAWAGGTRKGSCLGRGRRGGVYGSICWVEQWHVARAACAARRSMHGKCIA